MKRLAIVPARGGSKRIPRKNIKNFNGKPMLEYVLNCIMKSSLFDEIHVSTEDDEIKRVAEQLLKKEQFYRPLSLSTDQIPIIDVVKYANSYYNNMKGLYFDEIWLFMACNPLITPQHLSLAASFYEQSDKLHPLLSVCQYNVPIQWALQYHDNKLVPVDSLQMQTNSNTLEKSYHDTGNFAVFTNQNLESYDIKDGFYGFEIPKSVGIDIDDSEDWIIAEAIHKFYFNT